MKKLRFLSTCPGKPADEKPADPGLVDRKKILYYKIQTHLPFGS